MVGYQQEFAIIIFIDKRPFLKCAFEGILRFEGQRHRPVIAFAIHGRSKSLEAFHHDHEQAVWGVQRHVREVKLAIV